DVEGKHDALACRLDGFEARVEGSVEGVDNAGDRVPRGVATQAMARGVGPHRDEDGERVYARLEEGALVGEPLAHEFGFGRHRPEQAYRRHLAEVAQDGRQAHRLEEGRPYFGLALHLVGHALVGHAVLADEYTRARD